MFPSGGLVKAFLEVGPGSKISCVFRYLTGTWGVVNIEMPSLSQNRLFVQ